MSFTFTDATPVDRANTGRRTAEPNPFVEIVQSIALQKDGNGKPLAKEFTIDNDGTDESVKYINKLLRQLGKAGALVNPVCTVYRHAEPATYKNGNEIKGKTRIVFWTNDRQIKGHKPTDTATDGTPESPAPEGLDAV